MTIRTKFIDFDARRNPKTANFCVCCQKDIKAGQRHRLVFVGESMHAIHPDDVAAYNAQPDKPPGNIGPFQMGLACAKKLGLEWTVAIKLPKGWDWARVEAERAKWNIAVNMVPVVCAGGVVAWGTIENATTAGAKQ